MARDFMTKDKLKWLLMTAVFLLLLIGFAPAQADAAGGGTISFGTSGNTVDVDKGSEDTEQPIQGADDSFGSYTYDDTSKTLTLTEANITGTLEIDKIAKLTIRFKGNNVIKSTDVGIKSTGELILQTEGEDSVISIESDGMGISCSKLTLDKAKMSLTYNGSANDSQAINTPGTVEIKGGQFSSKTYSTAINAGSLSIADKASVTADVQGAKSTGVPAIVAKGITVDNSTISVPAGVAKGIWSEGPLTISNSSNITANGTLVGIGATGNLTIKDKNTITAISTATGTGDPTQLNAEDYHGIWSGGILNIADKTTITDANGWFSGISSEGGLIISESTITSAKATGKPKSGDGINTEKFNGIYSGATLKISDKSVITEASGHYAGISSKGAMSLDGTGEIKATSTGKDGDIIDETNETFYGIFGKSALNISDVSKLTASAAAKGSRGIYSAETLKIYGSANVTATGEAAGIGAKADLAISNSAVVSATGTGAESAGILVRDGTFSIKDAANVTASGKNENVRGNANIDLSGGKLVATADAKTGILCREKMTIQGVAQITAKGSEKGILSEGALAVTGTANVVVSGKDAGVHGQKDMNFSGGTINATSTDAAGILCNEILTAEKTADITATGKTAGIVATDKIMKLLGGKVNAKSTGTAESGSDNICGILSNADLMIAGSADITATGFNAGILGKQLINIEGGKSVNATATGKGDKSDGILSEGVLTVRGGTDAAAAGREGESGGTDAGQTTPAATPVITATGQKYGVHGLKDISLHGGKTVGISKGNDLNAGVYSEARLIVADKAELRANSNAVGIRSDKNMNFLGTSKTVVATIDETKAIENLKPKDITGSAAAGRGIYCEGIVTQEGDSYIIVRSGQEAIYGNNKLDLFSGTVKAISDQAIGVFSTEYITLGRDLSIYARGGKIGGTGTTQEGAHSAVEVKYEKTPADTTEEPKIECDSNLMPRGIKIGMTKWFEEKGKTYSRTSFVSEFASDPGLAAPNVPGFPEIDFVAIAPGSASKPNITKDLDDIKDSKTYTQYATNVQALHIEAEHGDINDKGILTYQWFYKENENDENGILIPDAKEASYVPSTAELGTRWYYCVVTNTNDSATDVKVQRTTSMMAKITIIPATDAAKPIITTDLSDREVVYVKDGAGAASLKVKGEAPDSGKVTYQWYVNNRQSVAGGTLIERAEKSSYKPSVADVGTKYYYCVVTNYNDKVSGKKSEEQTSKVAKITVCLRPDTPQAKLAATTDKSVKISWSAVRGAKGYYIYRCSTSKNGMYSRVGSTKAGTRHWTNTGRTTGKTYYYKVRAYKMQGSTTVTSLASSAVAATPRRAAPTFKLTPGNNSMKVSWSKSSGADGYSVYRATSKKGTYKLIKTVKGNTTRSYTSKKLKDKKTYYYKMRSYKMSGKTKVYSKYSAIKSAKTK